ncbi:energy-coupling factor ABC transporter permease [Lyngbya sp. CCAP 1446/10]|uniref:energy-coupling factor ABC transporter permease n=1 Tax=Lyngbya sp. CCAP 1446/10 TaxID=439293 RepID=UPI0022377DDB|nr:energy-coupling factor ABC transporter permease [Lyngbya sp. CCAP 1446/10]MCW6052516.1 energy-coupling factor ABC transporter permease [Lyngbya sp. CCAP 1446/10]
MHIPDGFLSPPVAIATGIASAAVIAVALNRTRTSLGSRQAPIMGLTTAFIFAAQMINFPVAGGTSGHLLGGALASVVLGSPWAATLAMSTVFIIQSVLFADGGITALGANIFNMGLVGIWVGWWLLQPLQQLLGGSRNRLPIAAGIAAALSVVAASICVAIELAISGTVPLNIALPAMVGVHILIGIGEGIITGGVLTYLVKVRPDLLPGEQPQLQKWVAPVVGVLLISGLLSLFASSWPDGLEAVAEKYGFKDKEAVAIENPTPLAGYTVKGLEEQPIATSIAGVVGSALCFGAAFGIAQLVKPKDA